VPVCYTANFATNTVTCNVAVELSTAEVRRYQNTISGTSGHLNSTPMVAFDLPGMVSY